MTPPPTADLAAAALPDEVAVVQVPLLKACTRDPAPQSYNIPELCTNLLLNPALLHERQGDEPR
jgi:hypothetical protein